MVQCRLKKAFFCSLGAGGASAGASGSGTPTADRLPYTFPETCDLHQQGKGFCTMALPEDSVITTALHSEVENRFLTYALSTIVSRSLPDVRDGLKPVHRRILFAMWEMGLGPTARFRKSAAVVGEVLGKFHPHGDQAAYDAMVRMAQDFSLRYPLVDGSGNFGSLDGDPAAAMRYTEARLSKIAEELLFEIDKDTVGFRPNYDNSLKEPVVLPARFPQLLVNGTSGIAVGMSCSFPPHNIGEVIDGLAAMIDNSDIEVKDLLKFIKGPDFPTGGQILNSKKELRRSTRQAAAASGSAASTRSRNFPAASRPSSSRPSPIW